MAKCPDVEFRARNLQNVGDLIDRSIDVTPDLTIADLNFILTYTMQEALSLAQRLGMLG